MSQTARNDIEKLEDSLWAAADNLRANSKLTSSEYRMPVLGVIFLRHAANRYDAAFQQIVADQAAGIMPKRRIVTLADIEAADWSLAPGRYVGVAPPEVDEDFDFEQALRDIHVELAELNREACALAAKIQANFEGLEV